MASHSSGNTNLPGVEWELQRYRPHVQVLNVESEEQRAALSQRHNLLFTAYEEDIYVWIPAGPQQLLGSQPEMIIHPVMKEPHAAGYIDPLKPHAINNLIVDDLGLDEVLLLATDSGNVTGYNVKAIFSAINRSAKSGHSRPFDTYEIKPFFAESVVLSAWGLTTHKFARLIAVSSNTGTITVFAFALVDVDSGGDDDSTSDTPESSTLGNPGGLESTWVSIDTTALMEGMKKDIPNHRTRNLRISYKGHFENIPCVSFANFGLDPNGLWMVSTDIRNRVFIWKVWESLVPFKTSTYEPLDRGWFVLPVHPRKVQQHRLRIDACGCEPRPRMIGNCLVFDVSKAVQFVATKSIFAAQEYTATSHIVLPDGIFSDSDVDAESRPQPTIPRHYRTEQEARGTRHSSTAVDNSGLSAGVSQDSVMPTADPQFSVRPGITNLIDEANEHGPKCDLPRLNARSFSPSHPVNPQFFPLLHFSGRDITLDPYPMDSPGPRTLSRSPFRFLIKDSMYRTCDRINMVKYLPDAGIVVAATQTGAVAIITLTWQEEIGHSFRVDWILPFFSQQGEDDPPLMGLAVSPMPGFEVPSDVPCIPRDVDPKDWLKFNFHMLNPNGGDPCDDPDAVPLEGALPNPSLQSDPEPAGKKFTLPEIHAHASSIYRPRESWHGHCPSRHYRLLLLFCDNSVMSYEFWHDWRA
ncbi:hypothetical protein N7457_006609 [Penicillium paradoxum]|uniref:uncharacterized protein n=1 Tax=Penicillium paradoxum TaxID=176176 RepID=UPI002546E4F8|nr:uncharacterized protein N7457_006609 [Penicillium paradoxum]KAJ5778889.1 hypothetical protein N7457_006609 [Penicillium paradoxum]